MRFHIGFSFRLKYLKKFLFPILIGILAYFGLGLFGCLKVNALVNYNTFYVFDIYENDFSSQFYEDMTYKEVLDYFSSYNSSYYNIVIYYNESNDFHDMYINLYPKDYVIKKGVYGLSGNNDSGKLDFYSISSVTSYSIALFKKTNLQSSNVEIFNDIINCLDNNVCLSSSSASDNSGIFTRTTNGGGDNYTILNTSSLNTISNDMSYNLIVTAYKTYLYYSQAPFYLDYSYLDSSTTYYGKALYINGKTYTQGSLFPSYVDLYNFTNLDKNYSSIDKIYIGQIDKNNISNLNLDISFNYVDSNFIQTLNSYINFYGRVNHGNYYTYDSIDCTVNDLNNFYNDTNNKYSSGYLFNGVTCSSSLSNYDYIYSYIQLKSNGSSIVNNLNISSNYGNLKTFNSTMSNFQIYESFNNLDYNDSFVLSSLSFESLVYYNSSLDNTIASPINKDDNINNSGRYNPLKYGLYNNTNAFIYNLPNNNNEPNYSIELFFTDDSLLSLSSSDIHTFYDENNLIVNDNIVKNNNIDLSDSYNISYYFLQVSNFVESLSLSVNSFSNLLQKFYDSTPQIFQLFIFVSFILLCVYFTYLLIRK